MSKKWEYKECFSKGYMEDDWSGHYEVTNGDIALCTIDDPEDTTETANSLQLVAKALNESACKFYVNTASELSLHNENMLLRMALEDIKDKAASGIFPHLPVETMGAQMCIEIEKIASEVLKPKQKTNGQQDTGTNKG